MKALRFVSLVAAVATLSTPLLADGLVKFKEWESSPQAYFMTKAERQEWSTIHTDDAAQAFVDKFLASRPSTFAAEVADRASQADKHLTIGHIPGSQTLRGKVIVLLGPPSGLDVSDVVETDTHRDSPAMASVMSGGTNAGFGAGKGDTGITADNTGKSMSTSRLTRNYHLTYAKTPAGALDVTIAADAATGKDRPRSHEDAKKLEEVFDAAAQASLKK